MFLKLIKYLFEDYLEEQVFQKLVTRKFKENIERQNVVTKKLYLGE